MIRCAAIRAICIQYLQRRLNLESHKKTAGKMAQNPARIYRITWNKVMISVSEDAKHAYTVVIILEFYTSCSRNKCVPAKILCASLQSISFVVARSLHLSALELRSEQIKKEQHLSLSPGCAPHQDMPLKRSAHQKNFVQFNLKSNRYTQMPGETK